MIDIMYTASRIALLGFFSLLFLAVQSQADDVIKEGKWIITVVTTAQGLPVAMPPQTVTSTSCVTKENLIPTTIKTPQGCDPIQLERKGSSLSYHTNCTRNSMQMTMEGNFTYNGDNLTGHVTSHSTTNNNHFDILTNFTGKYSGSCE